MQPDSSKASLACLLVHGLNGSPHDLQDLATHLRHHDIAAETLLLPGHDIHHRQAAQFGWADWLQAVNARFAELSQRHARVAIVGHSLGGALALSVAAHEPRVAAVATLCAPAELHPGLSSIIGVGRHLAPYVPVFREDISDRLERRAYRRRKVTNWMPMAPLQTLLQALPNVRTKLDAVTCPALIVAARRDHVVPMRDGIYLHKNIASTDKELVILDHSWHVVTRDVEREVVATHVTAFLLRIESMAARAPLQL